MIDLTKKVLPSAIKVDGKYYSIKTDFRYGLMLLRTIKGDLYSNSLDYIYCDEMPENRTEGTRVLIDFFSKSNPLPRPSEYSSPEIILDFDIDSDLIFSAFYDQYGIDLISVDMHWYMFKALLAGLHGTKLNEVMVARGYAPNDKITYEELRRIQQEAWRIEADADIDPALDRFNSLFD